MVSEVKISPELNKTIIGVELSSEYYQKNCDCVFSIFALFVHRNTACDVAEYLISSEKIHIKSHHRVEKLIHRNKLKLGELKLNIIFTDLSTFHRILFIFIAHFYSVNE